MVKYVDSSGWTWEVCELADGLADAPPRTATVRREGARAPAPADAPTLTAEGGPPGDGTLYFLSRRGTRKLRRYPRVWSSLPREQLEELCERAVALAAGPY